MARLETRREREREHTPEPTDDDAHLEDWFARRLESQGIPSKMPRGVNTRILAVGGFAVALLGLIWAFSVAGPGSSTSASTTPVSQPSTSPTTPTSGGGPDNTNGGTNKTTTPKPAWNTITVDVLNGSGISGAAAAASTTLSGAGWHTGATGDAGTETSATTVVYAPGHKTEAQVVANKLGLGAPVPITEAPGVSSTATTGVAIVLGPDGLPG